MSETSHVEGNPVTAAAAPRPGTPLLGRPPSGTDAQLSTRRTPPMASAARCGIV
jgi:hypothetical protein